MCGSTQTSTSDNGLAKLAGLKSAQVAGDFKVGDLVTGRSSRDSKSTEQTGTIVEFSSHGRDRSDRTAILNVPNLGRYTVWFDTLSRSFKVGDRVTGLSNRGLESSRITGEIVSVGSYGSGNVSSEKWADLRRDGGRVDRVWFDTMHAIEFQLGDYVTGSDTDDEEYTGEIIEIIDRQDSEGVLIREDSGNAVYVSYSTLQKVERATPTPAPVPPVSGNSASTGIVDEVAAAPVPAAPKYPVNGSVDFNKPLIVADTDYDMTDISVIQYIPGTDYPFVLSFEANGSKKVGLYNNDGENSNYEDSEYHVANTPELPDTVYLLLIYNDDSDLIVVDEVFDTEDAARSHHIDTWETFVAVVPANVKELAALEEARKASEQAKVDAENDNDGDDAGDDDDKTPGLSEISLSIQGRGYVTVRPGETIFAKRKGFGTREGKIVKIRTDRTKNILFQPSDGSKRYWALNKNLRGSRY